MQLELVLFYYLRPGIPELSPDSTMKILLDPGHGLNTPGKHSPDGTLLEAAYNREIAQLTLSQLQANGHDAQLLVPETEDIPLKERVRRVNTHCPAVLIENFFMDNKKDLAYLLSQEGRREIIETIIDGVERCVLTSVSG